MSAFGVLLDDERSQLDAFLEDQRAAIDAVLVDLTEEQARRRLVPSATTLLGLLKHVTWMQRVWFEECVGGTSRGALGLVDTPEASFRLADTDTVDSVLAAHRAACATARGAVADLRLDAVAAGHHTGPRTLRWVYLQVLRELAHHCGHADILREQVLANENAARPSQAQTRDAARGRAVGERVNAASPLGSPPRRSSSVSPSANRARSGSSRAMASLTGERGWP